MSLPPQIRLTRSLQERGRKAVRTKEEAEETINTLDYEISNLVLEGLDSSKAKSILNNAIEAFSEGRYQDALDLSREGKDSLDVESRRVIGDRLMRLRKMIDLGYTHPPDGLIDDIDRGELAMSTDITEAASIAENLRDEVRDFLLESRHTLRGIVEENVLKDDLTPGLLQALEDLDNERGGLDEVESSLSNALRELESVYDKIAARIQEEQGMIEKALSDIGPIKGMWDQANASKRRGDYSQAFDTLYRVFDELDSLLRSGIEDAFEFVSYRYQVLLKQGTEDETLSALIADMEHLMKDDPHRGLKLFLHIDGLLESYESDIISQMIESLSEMIMVGRRVGYDINSVILGLDEARLVLGGGDLEGAMDKIHEVEGLLRETMPGFMDMRESFNNLEQLSDELEEYDLDYTEVEKRADWGREIALRGDFKGAHEMIEEAISILGEQAKEILADVILDCQVGLISGFRMEAEMVEEAQALESIFAEIEQDKFNGKMEEASKLAERIDGRLRERAEEVIGDLRNEIDEHSHHIEVRPYREMMAEAEEKFRQGLYEDSYVTVWTARKKIVGQLIDAVDRSKRKVKDLIATAEYVNVDVSPLRREMYGLTRVGRQPTIEDMSKAKDLERRIGETIARELRQRVEELHVEVGRMAVGGIHLDKELEKLKTSRKHLNAGELRRAHELSREVRIEYEMSRILHAEVYNSMLNLSRIVEEEEDVQTLDNALLLFHGGKYRDADIAVKKITRKIIERGSGASAREILELADRVIDAGNELNLNVTSLKESYPQAEFFIENEDYRLASSLMEKAVRAGRSEIVGAFKDLVPRLREEVGGVQFRPEEKEAVLEMLKRVEEIAAGPEPEKALDIITTLQREASRRRELISSAEDTLRHDRILIRDGGRAGFDVGTQEEAMREALAAVADGDPWIAEGLGKKAVDQIGEMIGFTVRTFIEEMEKDELSGPDLENDLHGLNAILNMVSERQYHAAADIPGDVERIKARTSHKRDCVDAALEELEETGVLIHSEGMLRNRVDTAIEQVDDWRSKGTFVSAYVLAKSHLINLEASLHSFRQLRPHMERFRQMVGGAPSGWVPEGIKERLDESVAMVSMGDSEGGVRHFLELEDEALRLIQEQRFRHQDSVMGMSRFLGEQPPSVDNDHDLVALYHTLYERCVSRLKEMAEIVVEREGYSAELLSRCDLLVEEEDFTSAEWVLNLAYQCQSLDADSGRRLEEALERCRSDLERADSEGFRVDDELSRLWAPSTPREMMRFCRRTHNELEKARRASVPNLDVQFCDGYMYVTNERPVIAMDVRLDGRPLADKLGMGETVSHPAIEGRGLALVSYRPLLSTQRRTKRVLI